MDCALLLRPNGRSQKYMWDRDFRYFRKVSLQSFFVQAFRVKCRAGRAFSLESLMGNQLEMGADSILF